MNGSWCLAGLSVARAVASDVRRSAPKVLGANPYIPSPTRSLTRIEPKNNVNKVISKGKKPQNRANRRSRNQSYEDILRRETLNVQDFRCRPPYVREHLKALDIAGIRCAW